MRMNGYDWGVQWPQAHAIHPCIDTRNELCYVQQQAGQGKQGQGTKRRASPSAVPVILFPGMQEISNAGRFSM
jgi:hypothetical protein